MKLTGKLIDRQIAKGEVVVSSGWFLCISPISLKNFSSSLAAVGVRCCICWSILYHLKGTKLNKNYEGTTGLNRWILPMQNVLSLPISTPILYDSLKLLQSFATGMHRLQFSNSSLLSFATAEICSKIEPWCLSAENQRCANGTIQRVSDFWKQKKYWILRYFTLQISCNLLKKNQKV